MWVLILILLINWIEKSCCTGWTFKFWKIIRCSICAPCNPMHLGNESSVHDGVILFCYLLIPTIFQEYPFDSESDPVTECPRCPGQGLGCFIFGSRGCTMTWGQAVVYCQKNGARLAEPTDPYMSRVIANLFPWSDLPDNKLGTALVSEVNVILVHYWLHCH